MTENILMIGNHGFFRSKRSLCWVLMIALVSQSFASCAGGMFLGIGRGNKYLYTYRMTAPAESQELMFEDGSIKAQFKFDDSAIRFQLQNISQSELSILWSQVLLGVDSNVTAVRNSVTFYLDTVWSVGSEIVPSLGYVQEIVIPYHNVRFDGYRWVEDDLLPTRDKKELADVIMKNFGKSIKLQLPLQIGNEKKDYLFAFEVQSVHQIEWRDHQPPRRNPPPIPNRPKITSTDQITTAIIAVGLLGFVAYFLTVKKDPISE